VTIVDGMAMFLSSGVPAVRLHIRLPVLDA